jgi:predicted GIY-YIG superfamily endonuclease/phage anti-repressor protein
MISAKEFIKQTTAVPEKFVDELFEFYDEKTLQTDFVVDLDKVAKWLNATKKSLTETLRASYKLNIDYTKKNIPNPNKKHPRNNRYVQYMLTPDCFKMLCLMSRGKNAQMVRQYFVEVESMYIKYREQVMQGLLTDKEKLLRNQRPQVVNKQEGVIYVFKAHESLSLYKIGRSTNLKRRIVEHQTGRADDIDILYRFRTKDLKFVEECVHKALKEKKYRRYKEVFEADIELIKKLVNKCGGIIDTVKEYEGKQPKQQGGYFMLMHQI